MTARRSLILLLSLGLAATACGRRVPSPPPTVLAESGTFSRLDPSGKYLPVAVPAALGDDAAVLTGPGSDNVLRLPGGGSVRLGSATAVAVQAVVAQGDRVQVQLQVDQGRVWAQPKAADLLTLASFNCQVNATASTIEEHVFEDASHFKNTDVKVWSGRAHVSGGPGLKSAADLTYGMSIHADDAGMKAPAPFDDTRLDAWEKLNHAGS